MRHLSYDPARLGKIVALTLATLLVTGCASGPKVFVNQSPAADFSGYRTYNYTPDLGTDDGQNYRSVLSNHLIASTDRQMQARGYTRADDPDLLINFFVNTAEKIRTTSTPTMAGYYGYRRPYYGVYSGYETQVTQYTEGTLNIDLVDRRRNELAWEGIAVGRVTDKVRENVQAAVDVAVSEVFERYPYTAAGFVPPAAAGTP